MELNSGFNKPLDDIRKLLSHLLEESNMILILSEISNCYEGETICLNGKYHAVHLLKQQL